jgi:8-oxo-dGTP pyrophosphatase MutT (NUDIX family)
MKKKKVRVDDKDPGTAGEIRRQYGAVPYRIGEGGHLEVMLVTSRETRRWVVPKGWPMKRRTPAEAAAREAFEEAGVLGEVGEAPLGTYSYLKAFKGDLWFRCEVQVFPLEVRQARERWPEAAQRTRRWFTPAEAAEAVNEPELQRLIRDWAA